MRNLTIRLRLAWAALTGKRPADAFAARLMRQRDTAWRDLDALVRNVLLAPDLTAAKVIAATALRDLEIGGTGATWALANAALGVSPPPELRKNLSPGVSFS